MRNGVSVERVGGGGGVTAVRVRGRSGTRERRHIGGKIETLI